MATSIPLQLKVAIYHSVVNGESARTVAIKYGISHPTVMKYAQEAAAYLVEQQAVLDDDELARFLRGGLKLQAFSYDTAMAARLQPILAPILLEAEGLLNSTSEKEPTLPISSRVPEALFYQFRRLTAELAKARGDDKITMSSLLAEIITSYVESGKVPESEVQFTHADLLLDDIRSVLARHGLTRR